MARIWQPPPYLYPSTRRPVVSPYYTPKIVTKSSAGSELGANISLTVSSAASDGQLVLIFVNVNNITFDVHPSPSVSGFTSITAETSSGWGKTHVFGKIASSEGTSYTVSNLSGADSASAIVLIISGAASTLPTNYVTDSGSVGAYATFPAITWTGAASLDIACAAPSGGNQAITPSNVFLNWQGQFNEEIEYAQNRSGFYYSYLAVGSAVRFGTGSKPSTVAESNDFTDVPVGIRLEILAAGAGGTAAVSGTITTANESDVRTGGKTIVLTLTGDTWVAAGATFDAERQNIINGLDSAQSETNGWNNIVQANQGVTGVVRTSDTVVTITLDAFASYNISSNETVTVTIPGSALTSSTQIIATPTFSVSFVADVVDLLDSEGFINVYVSFEQDRNAATYVAHQAFEDLFREPSNLPFIIAFSPAASVSFTTAVFGTSLHDSQEQTLIAWQIPPPEDPTNLAYISDYNNKFLEVIPVSQVALTVSISASSGSSFSSTINGTNFDSSYELVPSYIESFVDFFMSGKQAIEDTEDIPSSTVIIVDDLLDDDIYIPIVEETQYQEVEVTIPVSNISVALSVATVSNVTSTMAVVGATFDISHTEPTAFIPPDLTIENSISIASSQNGEILPVSNKPLSVSITSTSSADFTLIVNGTNFAADDQQETSYIAPDLSADRPLETAIFDTEVIPTEGTPSPPDVPIVDGYDSDIALGIVESISLDWFNYQPYIEPIYGQKTLSTSVTSTSSVTFVIAINGTSFHDSPLENELVTANLDAHWLTHNLNSDRDILAVSTIALSVSINVSSTVATSLLVNGTNFDTAFEQVPSFVEPDFSRDAALAASFIDNHAIPIEGTPLPPDVPIIEGYESDVAVGIVESIKLDWSNETEEIFSPVSNKPFSVAVTSTSTVTFTIAINGTNFSDSSVTENTVEIDFSNKAETIQIENESNLIAIESEIIVVVEQPTYIGYEEEEQVIYVVRV